MRIKKIKLCNIALALLDVASYYTALRLNSVESAFQVLVIKKTTQSRCTLWLLRYIAAIPQLGSLGIIDSHLIKS